MDKLTNYIQNGKPLTGKKLLVIFAMLALVWGGAIYALMLYFVQKPEAQQFIQDIPAIEIRDGYIVNPTDTIWHKTFPGTDAEFYVDTTQDEVSSLPAPTVFYMTRRKVYMSVQGQVQEEELSTENILINKDTLTEAIHSFVPKVALLMAILTFLLLWCGMWGTYLLCRLFLSLKEQTPDRELVKRSVCIGWLSVFGLNIILLILGHGFGLLSAITIATIISIFSVIYTTR